MSSLLIQSGRDPEIDRAPPRTLANVHHRPRSVSVPSLGVAHVGLPPQTTRRYAPAPARLPGRGGPRGDDRSGDLAAARPAHAQPGLAGAPAVARAVAESRRAVGAAAR